MKILKQKCWLDYFSVKNIVYPKKIAIRKAFCHCKWNYKAKLFGIAVERQLSNEATIYYINRCKNCTPAFTGYHIPSYEEELFFNEHKEQIVEEWRHRRQKWQQEKQKQ